MEVSGMIRHEQQVYCHCWKCKEDILIDRVTVRNGSQFLNIRDEGLHGWTIFTIDGRKHYICPKHKVEQTIIIDGKLYE